MKKLFIIICALFVGIVYADNVITSKEYVDGQSAALQPQVQAKNTNTVLTYPATGTDAPGEKAIYDSSAAYGAQTDALVTAGQFNNALQTALDSEFVCVSRNDQGCLLYEIRAATPATVSKIANGYTQLEYIESTGTQFIKTNKNVSNGQLLSIHTEMQVTDINKESFTGVHGGAYFGIAKDLTWAVGSQNGNHTPKISADTNKHIFKLTAPIGKTDTATLLIDDTFTITNYRRYMAGIVNIFSTGYSSYTIEGKIYNYYKIYIDKNLVFNGIPAQRDSDGELGMYDTVTNTFFTNSGTGEFIAGPAVNTYLPQGN